MTTESATTVEQVILPRVRDLGNGFEVRRALPSAQRRMVGPFIFFDEFGRVVFHAGEGLDVAPHPHIGLATLTYLIDGEILHRDSAGHVQPIRPGEVNWMTAGRGISHSERTTEAARARGSRIFGQQIWIALPRSHEEIDPDFTHHPADALPLVDGDGISAKLIAGNAFGRRGPVPAYSDMMYADVELSAPARLELPAEHEERAVYVVSGSVRVVGEDEGYDAGRLVVFRPRAEIVLQASADTRLMLLGGEPLPEKRLIFWNFVSSSAERIEQAKSDWKNGRFATVPGDSGYIPLPE